MFFRYVWFPFHGTNGNETKCCCLSRSGARCHYPYLNMLREPTARALSSNICDGDGDAGEYWKTFRIGTVAGFWTVVVLEKSTVTAKTANARSAAVAAAADAVCCLLLLFFLLPLLVGWVWVASELDSCWTRASLIVFLFSLALFMLLALGLPFVYIHSHSRMHTYIHISCGGA